jgi:glycerophosphoryl diester phosphodiesterase
VIVHDERLDRLFGVARYVRDSTVPELAQLGIPTLAETLAAVPGSSLIDLELKEEPTNELFTTLASARGTQADGVVLSSFSSNVLRTVARRAPSWSRWLNVESLVEGEQASDLGCAGVAVALDLATDVNLERWAEEGLEIALWTLREESAADWAHDMRLTALCVEGDGITAASAAIR